MRIVPFPSQDGAGAEEAWHTELEAALSGDRKGPVADSWRELSEDVRALAPSLSPEFEDQLRARIAEWPVRRQLRKVSLPDHARVSAAAAPTPPTNLARPVRVPTLLRWRPGRIGAVVIGAAMSIVVAALIVLAPGRSGTLREGAATKAPVSVASPSSAVGVSGAKSEAARAGPSVAGASAAGSSKGAKVPLVSSAAVPAPSRVQQLAASLSLTATPENVQATADRVARLTVSDGGFVQSSHVQVQQRGASEANLMLRLPSAKLSATLASLGQLAPVRAESQSLQDITDTYDAARHRLADVTAERQALLRALAGATTQGQIDSLRERLAQARGAIAEARSSLQAISQRASTAEVEVTVLGDTHAGSKGLTLDSGLHDAGRVLAVMLAVLLVAAAILVPLALLLVALISGRGAWRRYQRERVLNSR